MQEQLPRHRGHREKLFIVKCAVGANYKTSVLSVPRQQLLRCPTYGRPVLICGEN